jgi:hypothetical protein
MGISIGDVYKRKRILNISILLPLYLATRMASVVSTTDIPKYINKIQVI